MLNIVLHEPEMPANTGNIGRTCVATGVRLHLIEPDYLDRMDVSLYDDYNDFLAKNPGAKVYMATTKSKQKYTDVKYEDDCFIMFGAESRGIPEEILLRNKENCVRIPMMPGERSLNLSNSVGIVLYEALRQLDFPGLETEGQLHHFQW